MSASFTNRKSRGFTLIELLVVLFIISIVTTVALLSINRNESKELEAVANEISAIIRLAEEKAMLQANVLGVKVDKQDLNFVGLSDERAHKENWTPILSDRTLSLHTHPTDVSIKIDTSNQNTKNENNHPQVVISTNGDITPFTIYVGKEGKKPLYAVSGEADGHVSVKRLS